MRAPWKLLSIRKLGDIVGPITGGEYRCRGTVMYSYVSELRGGGHGGSRYPLLVRARISTLTGGTQKCGLRHISPKVL